MFNKKESLLFFELAVCEFFLSYPFAESFQFVSLQDSKYHRDEWPLLLREHTY